MNDDLLNDLEKLVKSIDWDSYQKLYTHPVEPFPVLPIVSLDYLSHVHDWKRYHGLTEEYDYCSSCSEKKS
jgi:hypothetical protein